MNLIGVILLLLNFLILLCNTVGVLVSIWVWFSHSYVSDFARALFAFWIIHANQTYILMKNLIQQEDYHVIKWPKNIK